MQSGTFAEQYVFEQLVCSVSSGIYYYDSDTGKLEIGFLLQGKNDLVPVEVKAIEIIKDLLRDPSRIHAGALISL